MMSKYFLPLLVISCLHISIKQQLYGQEYPKLLGASPLTKDVILVHIDDGYIDHFGYGEQDEMDVAHIFPLDLEAAVQTTNYSITSTDAPAYANPLRPIAIYRKSKGTDFSRNCLWNGSQCVNDISFEHWLYLQLPAPLENGKSYQIGLGDLVANLATTSFVFDEANLRSEAVHVNQIGYSPIAGQKYAYLSHWMGDGGALNLDSFEGNSFEIIDINTNEVAFAGSVSLRYRKTQIETGQLNDTPNRNFVGADVWECDFSSFNTPGSYKVVVEGIGSSFPFVIAEDAYQQPFYFTARGLFHHRAGIDKKSPHTDWNFPADHHPAINNTSIQYTSVRFMDESSEGGDESRVKSNLTGEVDIWGWYHDAGDWDGYPSHTVVPKYLLTTYELAPGNFADGDLNLPESGNGIPDILDEAAWLLNYFKRNEGPTGGRFGSRVHADFASKVDGVPSWEDSRAWYVFAEDPFTNYEYAGLTAQYAYCLYIAQQVTGQGLIEKIEAYYTSAVKAYRWAESNLKSGDIAKVRGSRMYAAAWLYKLTSLDFYQKQFQDDRAQLTDETFGSHKFSYWAFATIPDDHPNLDKVLWDAVRRDALAFSDTDNLFPAAERSYRFGTNFFFPLLVGQATVPRAMGAILAYEISGEQAYLNVAFTTADYSLGGNPLNMCWVTGLGERFPQEILHLDSWYDEKRQMVPGVLPYGPHRHQDGEWNGPWDPDYARARAVYPSVENWPGHELYFENRYCPITNEYTVHQCMAEASAVFGYLSGNEPITVAINFPIVTDLPEKQPIGGHKLAVFPNPAQETMYLAYPFPAGGVASVHLVDLLGNEIDLGTYPLEANTKKLAIQLQYKGLPAGIYLVKMQVNQMSQKLVVGKFIWQGGRRR